MCEKQSGMLSLSINILLPPTKMTCIAFWPIIFVTDQKKKIQMEDDLNFLFFATYGAEIWYATLVQPN